MGQPVYLEELCPYSFSFYFAMAPGSCAQWSTHINYSANRTKQNELASAQNAAKRSNASSNKISTLFETLTPSFVPPPTKNLFTKFMKVFMELT